MSRSSGITMRKLQLSSVQGPGQVQFQYLLQKKGSFTNLFPCSLKSCPLMIQALCQTLAIWEENEDFHFEHRP